MHSPGEPFLTFPHRAKATLCVIFSGCCVIKSIPQCAAEKSVSMLMRRHSQAHCQQATYEENDTPPSVPPMGGGVHLILTPYCGHLLYSCADFFFFKRNWRTNLECCLFRIFSKDITNPRCAIMNNKITNSPPCLCRCYHSPTCGHVYSMHIFHTASKSRKSSGTMMTFHSSGLM